MTGPGDFREDERLAVYGSLQPGGPNAHILGALAGIWLSGTVRGRLVERGWGAQQGYPGIRLNPRGNRVPVKVFCSHELPGQWPMLDRFEGREYRRSVVQVTCAAGDFTAQIYEVISGRTEA